MHCLKCLQNAGALAGQGFTQWTCEKCGKTFWHHNTKTPKVCEECSEKFNLCEDCGEIICHEIT